MKNRVATRHRGQANAGKSTLLNALFQRKARHRLSYSGTRDTIGKTMNINGLVFVLSIPPASGIAQDEIERSALKGRWKKHRGRSRFICGRCYHQRPADLAEDLKNTSMAFGSFCSAQQDGPQPIRRCQSIPCGWG